MIVDHLGTSKECFKAILSPFGPVLRPKQARKPLKWAYNESGNKECLGASGPEHMEEEGEEEEEDFTRHGPRPVLPS